MEKGKEDAKAGGTDMKIAAGAQVKIKWDDSSVRSAYANVCNVAGTREEFILLFGMNQAWNPSQKELTVHLSDRIVMSPFAAKRLALLLNNVLRDYEAKHGTLDLETPNVSNAVS